MNRIPGLFPESWQWSDKSHYPGIKNNSRFRLLRFLLLFAFVIKLTAQGNTCAQGIPANQEPTPPLFVVENLLVRATGIGSAAARKRAFELAHIGGLREVVRRLTTPDARANIKMPELDDLTSMIKKIDVTDQRLSDSTFVALMTLYFSEEEVRDYLSDEKITFSINKSKPFLILPLLYFQGEEYGWGRENPWFRVWKTNVLPSGLIELKLPETQALFERLLSHVRFMEQNPDQEQETNSQAQQPNAYQSTINLQNILARKDSSGLLVAKAQLQTNEKRQLSAINVKVSLYSAQGTGTIGKDEKQYQEAIPPGEDATDTFEQIATIIASDYNEAWKRQTGAQANIVSQLDFQTAIEELDDWLQLEETLKQIATIERVDLQSLSGSQAIARITFSGKLEQLSLLLSQQGFTLVPSIQHFFLIKN